MTQETLQNDVWCIAMVLRLPLEFNLKNSQRSPDFQTNHMKGLANEWLISENEWDRLD